MTKVQKNSHNCYFPILCIVFLCGHLLNPCFAQNGKIKIEGAVFDKKSRETLIGANISLAEDSAETSGTASGLDGKFILYAPSLPATISIAYIGYNTEELIVADVSRPVAVYLSENTLLNEVVVIGYGTQKRKELTGSVASVSQSVIEHPATSFDKMLGGAVAGVSVTQSSGQPGSASSIRIRGGNSINASNDPLYVIDGFVFFSDNSSTKTGLNSIEGNLNPLASINPADIESIDILKDVSATAIYGLRGANGVIIVTTKKGDRNVNRMSYQYTVGWDAPAKKLDLLTATQWARIQKDFFLNKGQYTDDEIAQLGKGYDWQNAVLQTGVSQTHELSVSGGNDQLRYLVSGNYTNQTGIILNSGFERFGGRINIDRNITDRLSVGITATAGNTVQKSLTTFQDVNYNSSPYSAGIANSLTYALYIPPVVPIYNSDGSYNYYNPFEYEYLKNGAITANPVSDLNNSTSETINTAILSSFYAQYRILDGLTAKINAGKHISYTTQNFFAPSYTAVGLETSGVGGIGKKHKTVSLTELTLSYNKQINKNHYIDLLAGYTFENNKTDFTTALTTHFTNESLGVNNLADGAKPFAPISGALESKQRSYLGRLNYTLLNRYNLTSTIRHDKSTRLAHRLRGSFFPSVGVSWNMNEERFLKRVEALSNLKLRLTYGKVGNQEIGDYEYSNSFTASSYNGGIAYSPSNLGNENLTWETTTQYNAGIDAGFLNNRLSFVADVYFKKTSNLLLEIPIDPSLGVAKGKQLFNVGNVTNKGVEFSVNATAIDRRHLKWTVSANIARNINEITSIGDRKPIILGRNQSEILKAGEAFGSFYGLLFDGIVQADEDVSQLPLTPYGTPRPGDLKFVDVSGPDGVPDNRIDDYDRTVLGSTQPDYIFGLQSTLEYGNFNLFISFQGSQGNEVYNYLRRYLETPNDAYNGSASLLNSWTPENRSNTLPGLRNMAEDRYYGYADSRYIEDASFLRLKDITLSYTTSTPAFTSPQSPLTVKLFATAQNLFVLSRYKGYDPEVSSGIDLGTYPSARTFTLGARITY
jgi:TonB-linked SusC/RagA family outer membrane protein